MSDALRGRSHPDEVRAARRDASFLLSGRFNDNRATGHIPCFHVVNPEADYYMSGCGRILDPSTEALAVGVVHRCQRRGCKERWPVRSRS